VSNGTHGFDRAIVRGGASADDLTQRYFADRTDGLRPPGNAEELLVANT
jgi:hypothetical protein